MTRVGGYIIIIIIIITLSSVGRTAFAQHAEHHGSAGRGIGRRRGRVVVGRVGGRGELGAGGRVAGRRRRRFGGHRRRRSARAPADVVDHAKAAAQRRRRRRPAQRQQQTEARQGFRCPVSGQLAAGRVGRGVTRLDVARRPRRPRVLMRDIQVTRRRRRPTPR